MLIPLVDLTQGQKETARQLLNELGVGGYVGHDKYQSILEAIFRGSAEVPDIVWFLKEIAEINYIAGHHTPQK